MALEKSKKQQIIELFRRDEHDSGSTEVQVAILTAEIVELNEHLKVHKQDEHSRRGLYLKIGHRSRLLRYLRTHDSVAYNTLKEKLKLRK
ncbi:MAG: 30S ribosomal protein S15 [Acholeplasmatales bacterium]|jgi:small subunit ribosomal protein S15|nr:30S ribosomal protein S15 [Acholeplasmatales bacterium]